MWWSLATRNVVHVRVAHVSVGFEPGPESSSKDPARPGDSLLVLKAYINSRDELCIHMLTHCEPHAKRGPCACVKRKCRA